MYEKMLKKIKIGLKITLETSDILSETVTYKDVSRQGRNYKEVDKKRFITKEDFTYGNDRTAQHDSNEC